MLRLPSLTITQIKKHGITAYREVLNDSDSLSQAYQNLADEFGRISIQPWQPKRQNSKVRLDILNKTESAAVIVWSQRNHGYRDTSSFASYIDGHLSAESKDPIDVPGSSFKVKRSVNDKIPYSLVYLKTPPEYYEAVGRPLVTGLLDEVSGIGSELRASRPWPIVDLTIPFAKLSDPELIDEVAAFKPEEPLLIGLGSISINYSQHHRQRIERYTY